MNQSVSAKQLRPLVQGLCKKGKYQDASRIVMGFMEKGYVDYDAADLCARLAREGNNIPLAKTLAELAVKMAPKNWRSWQLSYQAHHADAHWTQALKSLNKIAKLSPSINAEHYLAKAEALERLFRPDEALACLAELEALGEKSAETRMWLLKVNILSQQKRYEEVIAVLPAWLEMASEDRYVASIWKVLARALDKQGRYEEAFSALTKGNGLQARLEGIETSTNAVRRRIEVFKSLFTPEWLSTWQPVAPAPRTPVFLLGFPRSGTTLLEQMLDAHESVQAMEEPPTISTVMRQAITWMQAKASMSSQASRGAGWKQQWMDIFSFMGGLGDEQVAMLRETYFRVAGQEVKLQENTVLVDKMPLNTVDIGIILRLFPDAKFVVALRHPCDCVLSGFMQTFEMNEGMANFLDLDDGASFYKHVMKLLWQYQEVFQLDDRIHYVRYEDLLDDFEGETSKILHFMGLEWSESIIRYDEHAKARGTLATPSYQAVTQKIYSTSKERWRHYAKWMEPVLPHFREAAERYGYDLTVSPGEPL